jgi:hypothetical protein
MKIRIVKSIIFIIIYTIIFQDIHSQQIPAIRNRGADWSKAGIYTNEGINSANNLFNITKYSGTNDQKLLAALNDAKIASGNSIIYFPQGTYLFNNPITLTYNSNPNLDYSNIVFQGDGSDKTILQFNVGKDGNCFRIFGEILGTQYLLQCDVPKDTKNIILPSNTLQVGNWVRLCENDIYVGTFNGGTGVVGQITKLESTVSNGFTIKDKASKKYSIYNNLWIAKINPIKNVGIENLTIQRIGNQEATQDQYELGNNIIMRYAVNCWIKGVVLNNTCRHHIVVDKCSHIKISGSYILNSVSKSTNSYGYGVLLEGSTNCLIENNIFKYLRHAMIVGSGANCNVFGYNYSREQNWTNPPLPWIIEGPDICLHGRYPYANLFEGNSIQRIWLDAMWGYNGPYNTFLRNRLNEFSTHNMLCLNADSTNFVGNDNVMEITNQLPAGDLLSLINATGYVSGTTATYDLHSWWYYNPPNWNSFTQFLHGEYYYSYSAGGFTRSTMLNHTFLNDVSYYLNSRPSFIPAGAYTWPPNGPQLNLDFNMVYEYTNWKIPAEDRYNQTIKTYLPDPFPYNITTNGTLIKDEVWSNPPGNSSIILTGNVTVPSGITLTIKPGAVVKIGTGFQILINGKVDANGAIFQSNSSSDWYGLIINGNVKSYLTNCKFQGCNYGVIVGGSYYWNPEIRQCDIQASIAGIWIKDQGKPYITDSYIKSNGTSVILSTNNASGNITRCKLFGTATYGFKNENSASTDFAYYNSGRSLFDTGFQNSSIYVTGGYPVLNNGQNCINSRYQLFQYSNLTGSSRSATSNFWGGSSPSVSGTVVYSPVLTTLPNPIGPSWVLSKPSNELNKSDDYLSLAWDSFKNGDYIISKEYAKKAYEELKLTEQASEALFIWMKSSLEENNLNNEVETLQKIQNDKSIHPLVCYEAIRWLLKNTTKYGIENRKIEELAFSISPNIQYSKEILMDYYIEILEKEGNSERADKIMNKMLIKYNDQKFIKQKDEIVPLYEEYNNRMSRGLFKPNIFIDSNGKNAEKDNVAFPNPFNLNTKIQYRIDENSTIQIDIYNMLGQRIRALLDDVKQPGKYEIVWDGTNKFRIPVTSGIYLCVIKTNTKREVIKLIVSK